MEKEYLTMQEWADRHSVSINHVRRLVHEGKLPAEQLGVRLWRIHKDAKVDLNGTPTKACQAAKYRTTLRKMRERLKKV